MSTAIESVLNETRVFEPAPEFVAQAHLTRRPTTTTWCAEANKDYGGFWAKLARDNLIWHKPFTQTLDESNAPFYKWFDDGELNASYNCLDRHLDDARRQGSRSSSRPTTAPSPRSPTRSSTTRVCQFANGLKSLGHQEGRPRPHLHADVDRGGRRDAGLRAHRRDPLGRVRRLLGARACRSASSTPARALVITADGQMRGGKEIAAEARRRRGAGDGRLRARSRASSSTGAPAATSRWDDKRDIWWHDARRPASRHDCEPDVGRAPSIRCSSSTRRARPASPRASSTRPAATCCGAMLHDEVDVRHQADRRLLVHRRRRLGHRPHLHRLRSARGRRDRGRSSRACRPIPDAGRFWKMIQDHKVTIFYTAPTAIRSLIKAGRATCRSKYDLSSLRLLGIGRRADQSRSVDVVLHERRRRALPDRRHLVADRDRRPHDHAAAGRDAAEARLLHVAAARASWPRSSTRPGTTSSAARAASWSIKRPWPSMIRTIWGDPERYKKSYFPDDLGGKLYLAGDGAIRDARRLLHDHGPHRRRAERLRPPPGHDGNRVGAGRQPAWSPKPRSSAVPTT